MTAEWKERNPFYATPEGGELLRSLARTTGLSAVTLRLCIGRGLTTPEAIRDFLSPKLETLKDPFSLTDMRKAAERLADARERGEKTRIFGDYDVDGTTGAALLSCFFREAGIVFEARQPDRFKDGYGLNVKAVEEAGADGVRVLVTVDCGITSFDAAAKAKELGIDLIVLDHHHVDPAKGIPDAYAVVDAHRPDDTSGLKELCGCGVAFYLCRALRKLGLDRNWWRVDAPAGSPAALPNLKQHLDLVVLATAADMVPLIGDNHALVKQGLEVLRNTKKPGVRALLEASGIGNRDVSPMHLGFTIGPRINASGRMKTASLALELLTTPDLDRGVKLAYELERLNTERQDVQNKIWDQVRLAVEAGLAAGKFKHAILVGHPDWHEGVVGIVASKVTETFKKPAAVIAIREDFGKGSVRSYGGRDVLEGLRGCAELLLGFGGHKHAAGLSVPKENLEALAERFDAAMGALSDSAEARPLLTEGEVTIEELDHKTLSEIEKLGPFGPGNPEPVFVLRARAVNHTVMKARHLKLTLTPAEADQRDRVFMEAVWFHAAERASSVESALRGECFWAAIPELNRFRGKVTPTLRVKDRRDFEARG